MSLSDLILAFVLAGVPWLAGLRLVMWLAPGESRLPILLGAGGGVGIGAFLMTLMILLRFLPVEGAVRGVFIVCAALAIWAAVELRRRRPGWDISSGWSILVFGLLGVVVVGAAMNFASGVWNGATHENLAVRMAMTAHMAAGDWPPADPYAPGVERLYRYTAQAWGASVMRIGGVGLFEAVLAITITSVVAIFGGIFATVASLRNYLFGLFAAAGFVTAAHASFLGLWKAPIGEYSASRGEILAGLDRELVQGFTGSHGFALLPGNDFTNVVAIAAGFGGAFLTVQLVRGSSARIPLAALAAVCFGAMAAAAEQTLPIALATLVTLALGCAVRRIWRAALTVALVAAAGMALALVPQGSLSAIAFGSELGSRASFGFTPENFLTLPTDAMLYSARTSPFFTVPAEQVRVGFFNPIVLKELPWVFLAFGLGAYFVARARRFYLVPFLGMALTAFLIPGLFTDRVYPINIARFTSVGVYLAGLVAGLVAAELWTRSGRYRTAYRVVGVTLMILVMGSWAASVPLWPDRLYDTANASLTEDLEVAAFLRDGPYSRRALVLPGPTTLADVITDDWEGQHKFVVAFGATSIPLGLDAYSEGGWYGAHFLSAYNTLDPDAMEALGIDTVVVAPQLLSADQVDMLTRARADDRLVLDFVSSDGARHVYTYLSDDND